MKNGSFSQAQAAVEYLADKIVDGKTVIAVGMKKDDDTYIIGVTAVGPLTIDFPLLPEKYNHFAVEVTIVDAVARAH